MEGNGTGSTLGKPMLSVEAPSMQAGACDGSCDNAAGAVSETPDQPWLSVAADVHIQGGCSAAPVAAAVKKRRQWKTAARKAVRVGDSLMSTDSGSTDLTVLLESRSDVDDRTESTEDVQMDAASGAESAVGSFGPEGFHIPCYLTSKHNTEHVVLYCLWPGQANTTFGRQSGQAS